MAGYECMLHEGTAAAEHIHTSLKTGVTISVCDNCLPAALIGALATELGVEMQGLYDAIKRHVDKLAREQERAQAKGQAAAAQSAGNTAPGEQ